MIKLDHRHIDTLSEEWNVAVTDSVLERGNSAQLQELLKICVDRPYDDAATYVLQSVKSLEDRTLANIFKGKILAARAGKKVDAKKSILTSLEKASQELLRLLEENKCTLFFIEGLRYCYESDFRKFRKALKNH